MKKIFYRCIAKEKHCSNNTSFMPILCKYSTYRTYLNQDIFNTSLDTWITPKHPTFLYNVGALRHRILSVRVSAIISTVKTCSIFKPLFTFSTRTKR